MTAAAEQRRPAVTIESAWEQDWIPLEYRRDGNVPGPVWKPLRVDPLTEGMTFLMHLPPNWHDSVLDYHPTVEESYKLAGATVLGGEHLGRGSYLYRPPGILHGPVSAPVDEGATLIQRMNGPIRILRYEGDELPHVHKQPITDEYKDWPVKWNEHLDTTALAWEPVPDGRWAGASVKRLHRNRLTGGGAVLLSLPAGWSGSGSSAAGGIEEFIVDGAIEAGGVHLRKWGYAYRPAGEPAGSYRTDAGATLLCWWDEADELA